MKINHIPLVFVWCCVLVNVECLRILALFPHTAKSHFDVSQPLMQALAEKGHTVTVISHFPRKETIRNYEDIDLRGSAPTLINIIDLDIFYGNHRYIKYLTPFMLNSMARETCEGTYGSEVFNNFMNTERTYDLLITELFNTDCLLPVNLKFKIPIIGISTCLPLPWHYDRFGLPNHPSYVPNSFMDYSDRLTFLERTENVVTSIFHSTWYSLFFTPYDDSLSRKYLGADIPHISSVISNISLFIVNTHFTLNFPRPVTPNVIEIGGIHIGKSKPLPTNIEKFINESSHGVIYFSLGSMIKGHTFPQEKREQFLKAFARFEHRVLWKWENETMPGKPDNVMIQQWMPQFDVLCHPNVKAFISHGGLLGATEAVHCGVPMLVMPQYGDQHTNARAIEANGGGVILYLEDATEERIYDSLKTILDPEFIKKTKELSARFRDRPMSPLDTAIYWIEYVVRHKGAPHLKTAAVDMPLYQYLLLDVIAFLLVLITGILTSCYYVLKLVLRRFFTKQKRKTN